jgi:hypothetical protein
MDAIGLPRPPKMSNVMAGLERESLLTRARGVRGAAWRVTPEGGARSLSLMSDLDLQALKAEMSVSRSAALGNALHPVVPSELAPPDLVGPVQRFLAEHPFESNVFGMTRFPDVAGDGDIPDPVATGLAEVRDVCREHGLEFHLASDRQMVDDLWGNVAAHMWGCRYGIAFFEERTDRGLNYNLTIEVGGMIVLGRRTALLKDTSIKAMPTDLVGKIYADIDLDDEESVREAISVWIADVVRS